MMSSVATSDADEGGPKLWGGRFKKGLDSEMEKFNASISYDKRMWSVDIDGSMAYAKALAKTGILTEKEQMDICQGLEKVRLEWKDDKFEIKPSDEDIHTANERRLTEIIGDVGRKLHTGKEVGF